MAKFYEFRSPTKVASTTLISKKLRGHPVLADSGYQGLQNEHSAGVILPKKKPKNGSLSASEQARNTKHARCRIVVEHTSAHFKKWRILANHYRGLLDLYA